MYTTRIAHVQEMSFGGINSLTFMPLEICSIKSLDICFFYHQFLQYVESVLKKLLLPWIFKNMYYQSWAPFGALEYMAMVLGLIVFFLFDKELHSRYMYINKYVVTNPISLSRHADRIRVATYFTKSASFAYLKWNNRNICELSFL